MTRFDFHFKVDCKFGIQIQKLDYNWSLRCLGIHNIGIERKFPTRDVLIIGKLETPIGEKTFHDVLGIGRTFLNLTPASKHRNMQSKFIIQGYVIIQGNSEKTKDCKVSYQNKNNQPQAIENKESINVLRQKDLKKLSFDFEQLLDPTIPSFSDVTLKCGNATLPAHKNILSARSPVFAAMFANPMKECIKNEVDISDIDVNTVQALLMYMYTGKINFTISSTTELLFAADKYQLQELKNACSDFLKDTISMQNVLKILVLGDLIDSDLKSFAVDYICKEFAYFSALENTEEWKILQKEKPALSIEILTSLVKVMNEKLKK